MTDQELETRLAKAVNQAAPNDLEDILSRCDQQEGKEISMTKTKTARPFHWRALIAACLALAIIGGGTGIFYQQANAVASVVSIDVNPSIELRVNRDEKVLSCIPLNEDAEIALAEMNGGKDLEGAKLTVAVNAIVGALVRHGYFDGLSSAILVSVEDKDQARAERMEEELRSTISDLLAAEAPNTTVLSQTLTTEPGELIYQWYFTHGQIGTHHDDDHHISNGKAALVNKVMQMNGTIALSSTTAYDKLCALTVEELNDLLEMEEMRIPIGKSEAVIVVEDYAGTAPLSSVISYVDPELDKGIYKVKLYTAWGEFSYAVDAFTGEILSGQADLLALAARPDDSPAPQTTPDPQISAQPQNTPTLTETLALLGTEDAWAAVCRDLDCVWDNLEYAECKLDYENGHPHCYELEFCWKGCQYEYEVDCYTGAVLKHEWEYCNEERHGHHGATPAAPVSTAAALIGEDAAWTAVCGHLNCARNDLAYTACELDHDDHCYELEFCWNGNQYEYEIDCYTGAVLGHEWETCDQAGHGHSAGQSGHHGYQGGHH